MMATSLQVRKSEAKRAASGEVKLTFRKWVLAKHADQARRGGLALLNEGLACYTRPRVVKKVTAKKKVTKKKQSTQRKRGNARKQAGSG